MRSTPFILRVLRAFTLVALVLYPLLADAKRKHRSEAADAQAPASDPCLELEDRDAVAEAVREINLSVGGSPRSITDVKLQGLHTVSENDLWKIIGRPAPGPLTTEQSAVIVTRLARTGLFARIKPTVRIDEAGPGTAVLEISLQENPVVRKVVLNGLVETKPEDVIELMFESPRSARGDDDDDDDDDEHDGRGARARCPTAEPPSAWIAQAARNDITPGIVWKGLTAALDRTIDHLYDEGYLLATLEAELTPEGTLTVNVDEGKLGAVQIRGVAAELEGPIRAELGLEPGQIFLLDDLEQGVDRVEERFPFIKSQVRGRRLRPHVHIEEKAEANGTLRYSLSEGDAKDGGDVRVEFSFGRHHGSIVLPRKPRELFGWSHDDGEDHKRDDGHVRIEGRNVTVTFEADRTDLRNSYTELLRHTQATSFAPGVLLTGWLWDSQNRVHLSADAGLNLNFGRPDFPLDWLIGPKVQVPYLRIAELGMQFHSITDTSDRWRVGRLDSYLNSIVINRPESEYYRRSGTSAFITVHAAERLTVGAEYRLDQYQSLGTAPRYFTLFNRTAGPYPNPNIDDGRIGSVIGRVEWSTEPALLQEVGNAWRAPETSLVRRDFPSRMKGGLVTVNTVEVADPRLGGEEQFRFVRVVSDTALHMSTGNGNGLRLRLRAAGGTNLPRQKQEALGGWNALRGYDFKEFRGEMSVLGMAEYHWSVFSAFADVGSVRQEGLWLTPKLGLGAAFNFGDEVQLAAAWRADERAHLFPELRLVIQRTF